MTGRSALYGLLALTLLALLTACGPGVAPEPTSSATPTGEATETAEQSPASTPSPAPTGTPTPTPTPSPGEMPFTFGDGFEGTLEGWQKGADVPEDPDRPGEPVEWSIEISDEQVAEGASSARFSIDGKQDDGTIWLMRRFNIAADQSLKVALTFDLWSASESFNTLAKVAAYAGSQPPSAETDFDVDQAANEAAGWKTYEYTFRTEVGPGGQVWVALGISAVWETEMTYYVDDLRAEVSPVEAGQPPEGSITVTGVRVSGDHVIVRGESTVPEGACVSTELWADGAPVSWWPSDACVPVMEGAWELMVPLDPGQSLDAGVQYMVRAYQPGGPNIVSTFPFDLGGPPTPPPPTPADDPTLLLPESAEPIDHVSVDLNGDGAREEIVLTGWGGGADRLGYDFLQMFVIASEGGEYGIAWQSDQLPTERAEFLQVQDLTGDGLPEVLSVQAVGASGERLYVLSWQDAYGWLSPQGGRFDGQDGFGENSVRVEDRDGDGLPEILASYGPAAQSTDVYAWDGQSFVYRETVGGSGADYEREMVAGAGVSLEVPSNWSRIDGATWATPQNDALRLGVRWAEIEPPQEPEAAVLPQPAQILESVPVELPIGSARRFVMEVYGEAEEGGGQAPVEAVEAHVLLVIESGGGRRAIDVYASAPTAEELTTLDGTLQRALSSLRVE